MPYDCITCGHLPQDTHDGRDGTPCFNDCIPEGECRRSEDPAVKSGLGRSYRACYWQYENGQTNGWYEPDPAHRKRTEDDPPAHIKPLPGQIGV